MFFFVFRIYWNIYVWYDWNCALQYIKLPTKRQFTHTNTDCNFNNGSFSIISILLYWWILSATTGIHSNIWLHWIFSTRHSHLWSRIGLLDKSHVGCRSFDICKSMHSKHVPNFKKVKKINLFSSSYPCLCNYDFYQLPG